LLWHHWSHIKQHEVAHLGDKAYRCQYCDGTFTQKAAVADDGGAIRG
jgi:aspartate carbamoyltransferase regulatory subunit